MDLTRTFTLAVFVYEVVDLALDIKLAVLLKSYGEIGYKGFYDGNNLGDQLLSCSILAFLIQCWVKWKLYNAEDKTTSTTFGLLMILHGIIFMIEDTTTLYCLFVSGLYGDEDDLFLKANLVFVMISACLGCLTTLTACFDIHALTGVHMSDSSAELQSIHIPVFVCIPYLFFYIFWILVAVVIGFNPYATLWIDDDVAMGLYITGLVWTGILMLILLW